MGSVRLTLLGVDGGRHVESNKEASGRGKRAEPVGAERRVGEQNLRDIEAEGAMECWGRNDC